jgi:hypothetical protein
MMDTQTATRPVTSTRAERDLYAQSRVAPTSENFYHPSGIGYGTGQTSFFRHSHQYPGIEEGEISFSSLVLDEAIVENDHRDALKLNELGHEGLASLVHTDSQPVTITPEGDDAAALAQAAHLGATDTQRAKLRAIIEAKVRAERRVQELTLELNKPIDASDRRVWPLFAKVALAANAHDYCSEYEAMGDEAGIPSRGELRDAGFHVDPNEYAAMITVTCSRTIRIPVGTAATDDDALEYATHAIGRWNVQEALRGEQFESDDLDTWTLDEVEVVD